MTVNFYDDVEEEKVKFVAIVARHRGEWVFCKHRERNTYEVAGGYRESGESIIEAARREFYEENGASVFDMKPACVYSAVGKTRVNRIGEESYGMLFYSEVSQFEAPLESEMEEVFLFRELPSEWAYLLIQPKMIARVIQSGIMRRHRRIDG